MERVRDARDILRRVRNRDELVATFDAIGRQFEPALRAPDHRLEQPLARFEEDRSLMLMVHHGDELSGGVIAFSRDDVVVVRAIGIDTALRGIGVGRRLLETIELEAMTLGATVCLGAPDEARGFYDRLGYRGKHRMRQRDLPPPGRVTELRVAKKRREIGDPEVGVRLSSSA